MKLQNLKNKTVCFFLVIALTLQSCSVYQKTPVTLNDAATANRRILIVKTDNTKIKFKKIEQIDGVYYGLIKTKGRIEKIMLTESDVKSIRILDKTATTLGNVAIIAGSLGFILSVLIGIALAGLNDNLSYN